MKRLTFEFRDHTDDAKLYSDRVGEFTVKELEQILNAVAYELQMAISYAERISQRPAVDSLAE